MAKLVAVMVEMLLGGAPARSRMLSASKQLAAACPAVRDGWVQLRSPAALVIAAKAVPCGGGGPGVGGGCALRRYMGRGAAWVLMTLRRGGD